MTIDPSLTGNSYRLTEAQTVERNKYIWAQRVRGKTQQQIADEVNLDQTTISTIISSMAKEIKLEDASEYVKMQLDRLADLKDRYMEIISREQVTVSQGRIVRNEDGTPVRDESVAMAAFKGLLDIQKEESKLLGLYAPEKKQVESTVNIDPKVTELIGLMNNEESA